MNNVARRLGSELQPQNHAAVSDGTGDHNQQVMPSPHKSGKYFGLWFVSWTRAWTHGQYLAELGNISGRGGGRAGSSCWYFSRSAARATGAHAGAQPQPAFAREIIGEIMRRMDAVPVANQNPATTGELTCEFQFGTSVGTSHMRI